MIKLVNFLYSDVINILVASTLRRCSVLEWNVTLNSASNHFNRKVVTIHVGMTTGFEE